VFRAGGSINYGAGSDQAGLNAIDRDFLSLNPPAYGTATAILNPDFSQIVLAKSRSFWHKHICHNMFHPKKERLLL
jgi:hypothetical protein